MSDCEIVGNLMFGITADSSAIVHLIGNVMERNDPVAMFIKGSTNVFAGANRISYGNGRCVKEHDASRIYFRYVDL